MGDQKRKRNAASCFPYIFLVILLVSALPFGVIASTPPIAPEITLSMSENPVPVDIPVRIYAKWTRFDSWNIPPEVIILEIFNSSTGIRVYSADLGQSSEIQGNSNDIYFYSGTVNSSSLPSGVLMVIATDPLSGSYTRMQVNVARQGSLFPGVRDSRFSPVFLVSTVLIIIILGLVLMALVIRK